MKLLRRILGSALQITFIVVLVLGAILVAFFSRDDVDPAEAQLANSRFGAMSEPQMTVSVVRPRTVSEGVEIEVTGAIAYRTTVQVASQVSGRVTWVAPSMRSGSTFRTSEVLFRLDPVDAELNVEQAEADLQVALAELNLTKADQDAAIENYRLLNPSSEVPPLVGKEPQIARSNAAVSRAKARLRVAELSLSRTEFSLPFDGRVLSSSVEVGQLVSMNQVVGQVYNIEALEAVFPISVADANTLSPIVGRGLQILSEEGFVDAVIERQSAELESRTRTGTVYARLVDSDHNLLPGQFIQARVKGDSVDSAYILPNAVEQPNNTVWIVRLGELERRNISIKDRRSDGLLVDAFDYFEGIVVGSMPDLDEGEQVRISGENQS